MDNKNNIIDPIDDAMSTLRTFVEEISGERPSDQEIAAAIKRYFILKEIYDQIIWDRENPEHQIQNK